MTDTTMSTNLLDRQAAGLAWGNDTVKEGFEKSVFGRFVGAVERATMFHGVRRRLEESPGTVRDALAGVLSERGRRPDERPPLISPERVDELLGEATVLGLRDIDERIVVAERELKAARTERQAFVDFVGGRFE